MSEKSEVRVVEYLGELRDHPPQADGSLSSDVAGRARWQEAVRTPARAVGVLTAALADGLVLVLGLRKQDP